MADISDSSLTSDEVQHDESQKFYEAMPGVKRECNNGSSHYSKPSKRMRMHAPAPPKGVKRGHAHAGTENRHNYMHGTGNGMKTATHTPIEDVTDVSDTSLLRRTRPAKKLKQRHSLTKTASPSRTPVMHEQELVEDKLPRAPVVQSIGARKTSVSSECFTVTQ